MLPHPYNVDGLIHGAENLGFNGAAFKRTLLAKFVAEYHHYQQLNGLLLCL